MIAMVDALLCEECAYVVDAREVRGERCPHCASLGTLLSLSRVLNPTPALGAITYIFSAGRA